MTTNDRTSQQKAQDLVITRIFDAPRELVWKAWTEPEQVMRWWGGKTITSPACKIDFRVGGKYHFCMRMPDGQDVWSTGVYKEIVPLERIVKTDSFADAEGNVVQGSYYGLEEDFPLELLMIITFEDLDGKTKMTLRHQGMPTGEMAEMTKQSWSESFDKLAESLK